MKSSEDRKYTLDATPRQIDTKSPETPGAEHATAGCSFSLAHRSHSTSGPGPVAPGVPSQDSFRQSSISTSSSHSSTPTPVPHTIIATTSWPLVPTFIIGQNPPPHTPCRQSPPHANRQCGECRPLPRLQPLAAGRVLRRVGLFRARQAETRRRQHKERLAVQQVQRQGAHRAAPHGETERHSESTTT